jgi:hypothetical protein
VVDAKRADALTDGSNIARISGAQSNDPRNDPPVRFAIFEPFEPTDENVGFADLEHAKL